MLASLEYRQGIHGNHQVKFIDMQLSIHTVSQRALSGVPPGIIQYVTLNLMESPEHIHILLADSLQAAFCIRLNNIRIPIECIQM